MIPKPICRGTATATERAAPAPAGGVGAARVIVVRPRLWPPGTGGHAGGQVRAALRRMVTSKTPPTDRWIRLRAALVGALAPATAIGAKDSASTVKPSAVQIRRACRV